MHQIQRTEEEESETKTHEPSPLLVQVFFFALHHGLQDSAGDFAVACANKDEAQTESS